MKIISMVLGTIIILVSVFFYGVHIGVVKTDLKYQKSSNQNNNQGNNTNDQATEIFYDEYDLHYCTHRLYGDHSQTDLPVRGQSPVPFDSKTEKRASEESMLELNQINKLLNDYETYLQKAHLVISENNKRALK